MDVILSQEARGVSTITLNRPAQNNAFNDAMIDDLLKAFHSVAQDSNTRVVVLKAAGKHFSAGADLHWMKATSTYSPEDNKRDALKLSQLFQTLYHLPKPTMALVQGAAYGGGVGLVACCDVVIAAHEATFCLSEVKLGLVPAVISPFVIKAIGPRQARRYFQTAEVMDAGQAQDIGLVHSLTEKAHLASRANTLLTQLLANAPQAMASAKHLVHEVASQPIDSKLFDYTAEVIAAARASDEGKEGITAFLDKRPANFTTKD